VEEKLIINKIKIGEDEIGEIYYYVNKIIEYLFEKIKKLFSF
jgi:hypothetical protein